MAIRVTKEWLREKLVNRIANGHHGEIGNDHQLSFIHENDLRRIIQQELDIGLDNLPDRPRPFTVGQAVDYFYDAIAEY